MTDEPIDLSKLPPIGPIGKGSTWRARMYKHNRKVLARRMKLIAEEAKRLQERSGAEE
jgi:hypothetical protein